MKKFNPWLSLKLILTLLLLIFELIMLKSFCPFITPSFLSDQKLEVKALLKSTNMTIQQISDELNFPSQSFFGKYFKLVVGMSPKEYEKS